MRLFKYKPLDENLTARFVVPVVLENTFTTFVGLVISQVVSTISASALVAVGMATSVMGIVSALFNMLTTGTGILFYRQVGAEEYSDAAETVEQATFMGLFSTLGFTAVCLLAAEPILRLFMPNAEPAMVKESVGYFSVVVCGLPFQVLRGVFGAVCRGLGDSRTPLAAAVSTNLCQLVFAWVFVHFCHLDEIGVGLAGVLCNLVGTAVLFRALARRSGRLKLRLRNMLLPRAAACMRILRIGLPVSVQGIFSSFGVTLVGSMVVSLGTFESSVYQIINTLAGFTAIPRTVCSVVIVPAVGHLVGAKRYKDARKAGGLVFAATSAAGVLLNLLMIPFAEPLCGLYSSDPVTVQAAASLLWIVLPTELVWNAMFATDGMLSAGGDTVSMMTITLLALWCVRVPLTYLVCYVWPMGAVGVICVNIVLGFVRASLGLLRLHSGKWIRQKV